MQPYEPPVAALLEIGFPEYRQEWIDYSGIGIGPEHVPELIRLLSDNELLESNPDTTDQDDPRYYAFIHAWRALGQLRATEAIEPLVELLSAENADFQRSEWIIEEVPTVLGLIGPAAMPAVAARLDQVTDNLWSSMALTSAITVIAQQNAEARSDALQHLTRLLEAASENDPTLNGFILADLCTLNAKVCWPVIERAFDTGNVNERIVGDAPEVKWKLGLGPKPIRDSAFRYGQTAPPHTNAKQRFNERQRKKKLEKKQRKKNRK